MSNSIDPRAENVKENSSDGSTLLIDQVLQLDKIFEDRERSGLIQRKSAEKATEFRNKGNQVYRKKGHNETRYRAILSFYSQSMAYAPPGSEEIALALSNRSVLWLHLHKFDLCSIDIDTALDLTKSSELKAKLIARKIKCVEMHHEYHEICCECGESLHDDPQEPNKNKETKSPILTNFDKKLEFPRFIDRKKSRIPKFKTSKLIPCAADSITLKHDEKYGRHYVANRDIEPGEILMSEGSSYVSVDSDQIYLICSHCLAFAWVAVPCDSCVFAIYCSETCKKEAWSQYHDVQCPITPFLESFLHKDGDLSSYIKLIRMMVILLKTEGLRNVLTEAEHRCEKENVCSANSFMNIQMKSGGSKSIMCLMSSDEIPNDKELDNMILVVLNLLIKSPRVFKDQFHYDQSRIENEELNMMKIFLKKLYKISKLNSFKFQVAPCVCDDYTLCRKKEDEILYRGTIFATCSSLFNHSCDPNVSKIFLPGPKIVLFTFRPVKKGEQLFISYVSTPDMGHKKRQENLLRDYSFTCDCKRCAEKWFGRFRTNDSKKKESTRRLLQIQSAKHFGELESYFLRLPKDWFYNQKFFKGAIKMCEFIHKNFTGHEAHDMSQTFRIYIHRYFFYVYSENLDLI